MNALQIQIKQELKRFNAKKNSISSIFIGGGTPSTVAPKYYKPIFEILLPYLSKDVEITTEANPNSASYSWLIGMYELGVNRISFGVQSFNSNKLKFLGRSHSPNQAIKAIEDAYRVGFRQISLDLIYNCAKDSKKLLLRDLNEAFALPITHISAYELTIEANTPFEKTPQVRQENIALSRWIVDEIQNRGFKSYEISNFGDICKHNLGYWELQDYIGLGAGAVGFLKNERFYPYKSIDSYISKPLAFDSEILSPQDLKIEKLFLGLRSIVGVDEKILSSLEIQRAKLLKREGKLQYENGRYKNIDYFLADEIALYILE